MRETEKRRNKKVNFIKEKLLRDGLPRVQVSVILILTALTGFLASYLLLRAGVSSMTLRYPAAIVTAYCVFLLLLRLWIWLQKNTLDVDLSGANFTGNSGAGSGGVDFQFGGGGDFAGGGAGGSWGESVSSAASSASDGGSSSSIFDGVGFDFDAEELGLVIVAVVALIGGLLASLYIVYIAPLLLAEILVDAVLTTGLYNRVKRIEKTHWLKTAVKRTIVPAVLAVIFFAVAGFAFQQAAPEARSIGEVWTKLGQ